MKETLLKCASHLSSYGRFACFLFIMNTEQFAWIAYNMFYRCGGSLSLLCCAVTLTVWKLCPGEQWTLKVGRILLWPVMICLNGTIRRGMNLVRMQQ